MSFKTVKIMGIINITPDSFSDGNRHNTTSEFTKRLREVILCSDIVDIGAESTAPFNSSIGVEEELYRYKEILFPYIKSNIDPKITLSIDTYKVDVFKEVASYVHEFWPKTKIIFNDVSGKIDDELKNLFNNFKVPFSYVFSHNLCPSRSKTSDHAQYINQGELLLDDIAEYFSSALKILNQYDVKILLDPCFGFSKNRSQNQLLLKNIKTLFMQFPDNNWVYGISRKSFLRFPEDMNVKDPANQIILDHMQTALIYELLKDGKIEDIIFRVHEPTSLLSVQKLLEF